MSNLHVPSQPAGTNQHPSLESLPLPVQIPKVSTRQIIWDVIQYFILLPCLITFVVVGTFLTSLLFGRLLFINTNWGGSSDKTIIGTGELMGFATTGLLFSPNVILYLLPARWEIVKMYQDLVRPKGTHIVIVWIIFFVLGFPCAAIAGALCGLKWEGVNAAVNTLSYCFGMSMFGLAIFLSYLLFKICQRLL